MMGNPEEIGWDDEEEAEDEPEGLEAGEGGEEFVVVGVRVAEEDASGEDVEVKMGGPEFAMGVEVTVVEAGVDEAGEEAEDEDSANDDGEAGEPAFLIFRAAREVVDQEAEEDVEVDFNGEGPGDAPRADAIALQEEEGRGRDVRRRSGG